MTAIAILTRRLLADSLLDLIFAMVAPLLGLVGFALLLRNVIDTGAMSYSQYVLPAVVVQAMLFGALTTTDRAAHEKASGMSSRLRTLPISPYAGLCARMFYAIIRGVFALIAAVLGACLLGFRFTAGFGYIAAFVALSLTLTLALSFGADATGAKSGRTEMASQLLLVPQLLLVLLSTGMAPLESFPAWLHPFVRYQPISQITDTLRGFTSGHVDTTNLIVSLAWCGGLLLVCGTTAIRLQGSRR
jgi:ABC-2 type transport system permease protein